MKRTVIIICCVFLLLPAGFFSTAAAQQERPEKKPREGVFELTLKTPEKRKVVVDELVRDRDLNPAALYRVKTGGYLSFDEDPWVEKIEFKVFDRPVAELPQYQKFVTLLVEINKKVLDLKDTMDGYDILALRMVNICDRSRFSSLQDMDDSIAQQLSIYRELVLLRSLVVNAMNRFVVERSCKDKYAEYNRSLGLYSKQLTVLSENHERLVRRALAVSKEVKGSPETPAPEKGKQE